MPPGVQHKHGPPTGALPFAKESGETNCLVSHMMLARPQPRAAFVYECDHWDQCPGTWSSLTPTSFPYCSQSGWDAAQKMHISLRREKSESNCFFLFPLAAPCICTNIYPICSESLLPSTYQNFHQLPIIYEVFGLARKVLGGPSPASFPSCLSLPSPSGNFCSNQLGLLTIF